MRRPLLFAILTLLAGCDTTTTDDATTDESSLTSADELVGTWIVGPMRTGMPDSLQLKALHVSATRNADGSHPFHAWIGRGNVDSAEGMALLTDYSFDLRGTIVASATSISFSIDESDWNPELRQLPQTATYDFDVSRQALREALGGAWTVSSSAPNRIVIGRPEQLSAAATTASAGFHTLEMLKRPSYCERSRDCAIQPIDRSCPGPITCDRAAWSCKVACERVVAGSAVRLRVASQVPADGIVLLPIFLDTKTEADARASYEVLVDRADVFVGEARSFTGYGAMFDGFHTPYEARWHLAVCDARVDASCQGRVNLRVRQVGGTSVLAEATIDLVPPTDDMPIAACLGLAGNVAQFRDMSDGRYATRTFGNLAYAGGTYVNKYRDDPIHYHQLNFISPIRDGIDSLTVAWKNLSAESLVPDGPIDVRYGHLSTNAGTTSRLRIDKLEADADGTVKRATLSWHLVTVHDGRDLRGCFRYDRDAPALDLRR